MRNQVKNSMLSSVRRGAPKRDNIHFTKAAEIYDAMKTGVYTTPLQKEFGKLSEYDQAAVVESIFANLHKIATREAWYIIRYYKFDPKKVEDMVSIIDEKMVEIFNFYNKSANTTYTISTFICIYKFEYIRSLMGEERSLSEAKVKNLSAIHRTMRELMNENGIATEDITPKMVKERMDEKWPSHPLSVGLIESMMDWLKGALSFEEMFDINDIRLNDPSLVTAFTENEINVSNLDSRTRSYFGKLFEKMTDKDWLVFLKNNGMLGDDLQEMEAEQFSETEIYYTVFGKKTGANAKEKMTKTVYNRTIMVNKIMENIPYKVKIEYVKEFKEYFEEQVERIISEYFE